ncbi:MAG: hypothetical protein IPK84_04770 [Candidatus Moraniibacteriota bacterium]|nr:MAG: hypothetical protein IPK84_04770 [Candidatus Moranbacteria bacterium]
MSRKMIGISILLSLSFAVFSGWFVLRDQDDQRVLRQSSPVVSDQSAQPENAWVSGVPGSSNWKIYRNEEYGFEIQYPMEWAVRREDNDIFLGPNDSERVVPLLRLTVEKNKDIKEWVRDLRNDKPSSPYKNIISQEDHNVGGNDGVKIIYSTDIGLNEEAVLVRIGNGSLAVFSFPSENNISSYYETVIQTFRLNP